MPNGTLSIDALFRFIEDAFKERPSISSIVNLVDAFSAEDNSGKLNLVEFSNVGVEKGAD